MNNTTALFIRACRALDPDTRIRSVYRRFYCGSNPVGLLTLNFLLSSIVEEYNLIKPMDLIDRLKPDHAYFYNGDDTYLSYDERVYRVMRSVIRLSPVNQFPDYPVARRYR